MKIKEIRLYPTHFKLDVVVGKSKKIRERLITNRYGVSLCEFGETWGNFVGIADTGKKSRLKGERRIVMFLEGMNPAVIVHEIQHVLQYISDITELEIDKNTKEWPAYFCEYLFTEIMDKKGYKNII